jgi:hypothetical protein
MVASPEFETQAERVIGSNSAVQCGLRGRVKERPRSVYVGSGKIIGRGWAYILAVSARREEGLKDALEREVGLMSDMDEVTFHCRLDDSQIDPKLGLGILRPCTVSYSNRNYFESGQVASSMTILRS